MPLLDISRVPQRWLVCALLTWAFGILGYELLLHRRIGDILDSASDGPRYKLVGNCPYPYSNASWKKRVPSIKLPALLKKPSVRRDANTAFQSGRFVMLIPAGILSDLGFSKYVLGGGLLILSLSTMLPMTDPEFSEIYVVGRLLWGVSEAFVYPGMFSLMSKWASPSNLYLFIAIIMYGYEIGLNIVGDSIFDFAFLRNKSWIEGNMISGALLLLWLPFGYIFIHHSPSESPFMNQRQLPDTTDRGRRSSRPQLSKRVIEIPWSKILSSCPFLCYILAYCSVNWTAFLNLDSSLITFQESVLHIPMKSFKNVYHVKGISSFFTYMMGALISDWVIRRQILSRTVVSKIIVFTSVFIAVVLQVAIVMIECSDPTLFWILFMTSYFTLGLSRPTMDTSPVALSPWNAGVLIALTVFVKSFLKILDNHFWYPFLSEQYSSVQDQLRFEVIFYSILSMALIVPYLVFGSEEVQNWSRPS